MPKSRRTSRKPKSRKAGKTPARRSHAGGRPRPRAFSEDAVYWVAGPASVDGDDRIRIDEPMAIAREQTLAIKRGRLAQRAWLEAAGKPSAHGATVTALPVSDETAQIVLDGLRATLADARTGGNALNERALLIGLGKDPAAERQPTPFELRRNSATADDGTPLTPITEDMMGMLQDDGLHAAAFPGEWPNVLQGTLDDTPAYAAGLGLYGIAGDGGPRISQVLALADEPRRAAIRAAWRLKESFTRPGEKPGTTTIDELMELDTRIIVVPITAEDAQSIRDAALESTKDQPGYRDAGLGDNPDAEAVRDVAEVTKMPAVLCDRIDRVTDPGTQCGAVDTWAETGTIAVW